MRIPTLSVAVVTAALAITPAAALAGGSGSNPSPAQVAGAVSSALAAQGDSGPAANPGVALPATGTGAVRVDTAGAADVAFGVPAAGTGVRQGLTTVFDGRSPGSEVAVQPTDAGVRALVHITGPEAPERFEFPMGGAVAHLRRMSDGSVTAFDRAGQAIGVIEAPWARDADGRAVPTSFAIRGTTLVQSVRHRGGGFRYGITADPSYWEITKCAAAITWVVGSSVFSVTKIAKIKGTINALGGIRNTARLLVSATSWSEKMAKLSSAGAAAASYFLGIDTIRNNC